MELSARELRLGNLVEYKGTVQAIKSISEDGVESIWKKGDDLCVHEAAEANGIPITEEWLLDIGFEKNENSFDEEWSIDGFDIHKHGDKYPLAVRGTEECTHLVQFFAHQTKYVHQLQNLYFTITGEELILNEES